MSNKEKQIKEEKWIPKDREHLKEKKENLYNELIQRWIKKQNKKKDK